MNILSTPARSPAEVRLYRYLCAMKYNQHTLDKIEAILSESNYTVRYERGTFQSGYCILEERKVVVLNKFLQIEGRINTLIDLLPRLSVNVETLSPDTQKTYRQILAEAGPAAE